jgi:hypothetical protein
MRRLASQLSQRGVEGRRFLNALRVSEHLSGFLHRLACADAADIVLREAHIQLERLRDRFRSDHAKGWQATSQ